MLLHPAWPVYARAGIHKMMTISWLVFVLVLVAALLPLTAAQDGPANKVRVSRGLGFYTTPTGTGTGIGAGTGPCRMAAVQRIFSFTTHDGGV